MKVGAAAVDNILNIQASSMMAVTTFSLSICGWFIVLSALN